MLSAIQATWNVPIHLAVRADCGLDAVDQSKAAARTLRAAKAPSLTQNFQPFMVTVNRMS